MISTQAYSELLGTLYAAPLDETQWQKFLTHLCELTHSLTGLFLRNDSTLGNRMLASGGLPVPAGVDETYKESHSYDDPIRRAFMRQPRTGIIEGEDLIPHEEFAKTEAYRAVMEPYGFAYVTCIVATISSRTHEIITLARGPSQPRLTPDAAELLEVLLPHIQNALNIRRALGLAEYRALNAEAALDTSLTASILLDERGQIIHMNIAAQKIALAGAGFRVHDDRIVPTEPSQRRELEALIAAAIVADPNSAGDTLALVRGSRKRPLQLLITPLRIAGTHRSSVRALILATDPDRADTFPDATLRQLYGLTPAETEIANGLLTGFSLAEIAQLRRTSLTTIRGQMKSILAKTATQRQADLVRLLSTLPRIANPKA